MQKKARLLLTAAAFALCANFAAADGIAPPPEMNDSRLASMRYGAESMIHWIERMELGDAARAARLRDDVEKLRARIGRARNVDAEEAAALNAYLDVLIMEIDTRANATVPVSVEAQTADQSVQSGDADELAVLSQKYGPGGALAAPALNQRALRERLTAAQVDEILTWITAYTQAQQTDIPRLQALAVQSPEAQRLLEAVSGGQIQAFGAELVGGLNALSQQVGRDIDKARVNAGQSLENGRSWLRGPRGEAGLAEIRETIETMVQTNRLMTSLGLPAPWADAQVDAVKGHAERFAALVEAARSGVYEQMAAEVAALQAKYDPQGPFAVPDLRQNRERLTGEQVDAILAWRTAFGEAQAADAPRLAALAEHVGAAERLRNKVIEDIPATFETRLTGALDRVERRVATTTELAARHAGYSLDRQGAWLRGDGAQNAVAKPEAAAETMAQVNRLSIALDRPAPYPQGQIDALRDQTEILAGLVAAAEAGAFAALPEDVNDPELTAIAEEVLAKPRYDLDGWERLVINARPRPRDRIETRVFNGRLETVVREWVEFQAVTVESDGEGGFVLIYNTIAKFSRGDATTPVNEWILHKRFLGEAIAKGNF